MPYNSARMADDKKKDAKGPPKKDAKPEGGGSDTVTVIVGLTIFLVFVAYVLSGKSLSSGEPVPSWSELLSGERAPEGSPWRDDGGGDGAAIGAGTEIVNSGEAVVRLDLSGAAVVGEQPERAKGVVKQGPVEAFGRTWYFVDYEEAPDGWVESTAITDEVGKYTAFHIVPIVFDFLRPLAIGLALALGLLVAILWWKASKEEAVAEKRAAEAHRLYLERTGRAAPLAGKGLATAPVAGDAPANLPTDGGFPAEWGAPSAKPPRENERWLHVKSLLTSASTSDWRQAIIEADIMLEDMLRAIGYDGVTIGDMLKNVDPADFVTLDKAWEAHKVRNQIAHRGMDFRVDRNDAERVIRLYEEVFGEFHYL